MRAHREVGQGLSFLLLQVRAQRHALLETFASSVVFGLLPVAEAMDSGGLSVEQIAAVLDAQGLLALDLESGHSGVPLSLHEGVVLGSEPWVGHLGYWAELLLVLDDVSPRH